MNAPKLGPALGATIITRDLDHSIGIYREHLHLEPGEILELSAQDANDCGFPELESNRFCWLANSLGEPWLRFIEAGHARPAQAFTQYGWMSLEISVADVDALGVALQDSPFDIIGPPADLAMSDAIRAMQVTGPSGEVLYLTEIKRPVPPFQLPHARCAVDRLFIPVMMCPDREKSLAHYAQLAGAEGMNFETRITVISAALGLDRDHQHPVATLQLAGETLIEIDQVDGLGPPSSDDLCTGIALIHFQHETHSPGPDTGAAGERYLLTSSSPAESN